MKPIVLFLSLMCAQTWAAGAIEVFGLKWKTPLAADWKVEPVDGLPTLRLLVARPSTEPRRPTQYALAETPDFLKFTLEVEVRPQPGTGKQKKPGSLIIVYAWRGENHFNYVHISADTGKEAPHHNGVFHVYGGDRVRISPEEGQRAFPADGWYKVRVVYDGSAGKVEAFVNGQSSPSWRAVDLSLSAGRVGLGSFFNLGDFRNFKITGEPPRK